MPTERPTNRMSRRVNFVILLGVVMATSACSAEEPLPVATAPAPVVAALDAALRAEGDVGTTQIEILQAAVDEAREVTFEEYAASAHSNVDCILASGVIAEAGVHEAPADGGTGLSLWLAGEGDDAAITAVVSACTQRYLMYVEAAYQSRGSVQEWRDEVSARYYDAMFACLKSRDVRVERAMSMEELVQAEVDTFPNDPPDARCVASTGFEASITGDGN